MPEPRVQSTVVRSWRGGRSLYPVLAVFIVFLTWAVVRNTRQSLAFSPAGWASTHIGRVYGLTARQRMLGDFLGHYRLEGISRDSVTALLGQPDHEGYFHKWDLAYLLGPERTFFGVHTQWLVVRFDAEGRVSAHDVKTD